MAARTLFLATTAVMAAAAGAVLAQSSAPPTGAMPPPGACEQLAQTALPNTRIERAEPIRAGFFVALGASQGPTPQPIAVRAFCRVVLTLKPTAQSSIKSEVWLPTERWNGKFMMVGNGAWAGTINFQAMSVPLARGYAVAGTDTGHIGPGADFAAGKPELWADFGWRAVHETTAAGKTLTAAFFGTGPAHAYWNGCSTGGKQGLKAVQMFPDDFDGVIAGAPANNWARLQTRSLWMSRTNLAAPDAGPILARPQFDLLNRAAIAACDELDGIKDGEIADPRQCRFKPSSLTCRKGGSPDACLTKAQVRIADRIYEGPKLKGGQSFYPASPPGAETEMMQVSTAPWPLGIDQFRYYAAGARPDWDFRTLELERDVERVEAFDNGTNNAVDPDLSAFERRGGKLIQYHGWSDGLISPEGSINYYETVVSKQGGLERARAFHRLFMVPNMNHCNGGYQADWIAALEAWVEGGEAPDMILGQRIAPPAPNAPPNAPPRTEGARPICAYPAVARYDGTGSPIEPASFTCADAPRGARKGQGPSVLGGAIAVLYPRKPRG